MFTRIVLTGLLTILLSCKKETGFLTENDSAIVLLTHKPWVLVSHGFDDNNNGRIDPFEEGIEDCQKDNITHFYVDGTGMFDENTLSCGTGIDRQPFTWAFTNNETGIYFFHDSPKIFLLNHQELVLYKELNFSNKDTVKFILIYRH